MQHQPNTIYVWRFLKQLLVRVGFQRLGMDPLPFGALEMSHPGGFVLDGEEAGAVFRVLLANIRFL